METTLKAFSLIAAALIIFTLEAFWLKHIISCFSGVEVNIFYCFAIAAIGEFLLPKALQSSLLVVMTIAQIIIWIA